MDCVMKTHARRAPRGMGRGLRGTDAVDSQCVSLLNAGTEKERFIIGERAVPPLFLLHILSCPLSLSLSLSFFLSFFLSLFLMDVLQVAASCLRSRKHGYDGVIVTAQTASARHSSRSFMQKRHGRKREKMHSARECARGRSAERATPTTPRINCALYFNRSSNGALQSEILSISCLILA